MTVHVQQSSRAAYGERPKRAMTIRFDIDRAVYRSLGNRADAVVIDDTQLR